MNDLRTTVGGLVACGLGAYLMASALFGHGWLVGERDGLEVQGGIIDVLHCSKPDESNPLPMSIGSHEGCFSEMYARSELRQEAGSWFGATTHMTLGFGAGSVLFFAVLGTIYAFAYQVEVVPWRQPLDLHLFDIENGTVWVHSHPGALGARFGITALVALTIAQAQAPDSLAAGPDVGRFVVGCLLAIGGGFALDPRTLPVPLERISARAAQAGHPEPSTDLPVAEVEESDAPLCVRCGDATTWQEKPGRHRCGKCGLYQPLHTPGSQADA